MSLPLKSFGHLPFLHLSELKQAQTYFKYSESPLPVSPDATSDAVTVTLMVYKHKLTGVEAEVIIGPDTLTKFKGPDDFLVNVPVRVHSSCFTSERYKSVKCECQPELDQVMISICHHGGMIIYLHQEGRGIGIGDKVRAYNLQETKHLDTVEANRAIGLPDDMREYSAVRDILKDLMVSSIILLTNNPDKVRDIKALGVNVTDTKQVLIKPGHQKTADYLATKKRRMNHDIPDEYLDPVC